MVVSPAMVGKLLKKQYPDIYDRLVNQVTVNVPANVLSEVSDIKTIVKHFTELLQINNDDLCIKKTWITCQLPGDETRLCKSYEARAMLIGLLLLLYHPAKIMRLTTSPIKSGLLKEVSKITGLSIPALSISANHAITYYKAYKQFTDDVNAIYEILNVKYFNHGNN